MRDELAYQQLMEIAGVDYPDRPERFELVYCLLSLTKNIASASMSRPTRRPRCDRDGPLAGRRLARARSVRHVWRAVRGPSRSAPHPHDYGFRGHRNARISRSPAMSSCAIRKSTSASSMSR